MEKRLELEMHGMKPREVTRLTLDNCRAFTMDCLKDDFVSLETLSLIDTGLTSLEGFPSLPALKNLELGDNRLEGGFENLLCCPQLTKLHLGGNKIADLSVLDPLKRMEKLRSLDLFGCPVMRMDNCREEVFKRLPQIQVLDGMDRNNDAVLDSDDDEETNDEEEIDGDNDVDNDVPSDEDEDDVEDEEEELDDDLDDEDEEEEEEEEEVDDAEVGGGGARGVKRKLEEEDEK